LRFLSGSDREVQQRSGSLPANQQDDDELDNTQSPDSDGTLPNFNLDVEPGSRR